MVELSKQQQAELNGEYEDLTFAFVDGEDPGPDFEGGKILFISKGDTPENARNRWLNSFYKNGVQIKPYPSWYEDNKKIFVLTLSSYQSITGNTALMATSVEMSLPELKIKKIGNPNDGQI